jgi:sec-independent protein translocase protein TatB
MFDFDAGKLLVIGVVALIVIGPKELPRVLRQVGQAVGKLRRMAGEFQSQFMDAMKEAELEDLRKEAAKLADATKLDVGFNPAETLKNQIGGALEDKRPAPPNDDPDGVFLPTQQTTVEEPAALILPEPVDVAAAPAGPAVVLPEPAEVEPKEPEREPAPARSGPDPR